MKEGYIPKDQRKKILMLSDDIRTHSGVGNMAKEIVMNSAHHFNWVNLGGAVKHPEEGKGFDISDDMSYKERRNFTLSHFTERLNIYNEEKFTYEISKVNLK